MRFAHWFRNDLRLRDNTALASACARATSLLPVFVVDDGLLKNHISEKRRAYLRACLESLADDLNKVNCPLLILHGDPASELAALCQQVAVECLTFNRDCSPFARRRDRRVTRALEAQGTRVETFKDRVIFESDEVLTQEGRPFRVFTPFRNAWLKKLSSSCTADAGLLRFPARLQTKVRCQEIAFAERKAIGPVGGDSAARRLDDFCNDALAQYSDGRDHPGRDGTSRLSPALRFGTISIRTCVRRAMAERKKKSSAQGAEKWIDELIWRDFYQGLLSAHPRVLRSPFRTEFDAIQWNDDEAGFRAWCEGRTGYPIVDAGMRQLVQLGWMHNRVRMIVASFLVKDLLIDWRRGEKFFMQHLIDGDPAANNGGWQWAASIGTDAQPYFRIFNPVTQGKRYDPDGRYVRKFIPELAGESNKFIHSPWKSPNPPAAYPSPIVDHSERRVIAIARFAAAKE